MKNNTNTNVINITTGDVTYAIKNEYGEEIGVIRFNPADIDIIRRCDAVVDWLNKIKLPEEPTIDDIYEVTDKIKAQFDFLLNRNVSGEIFRVCNPLTLMADGGYFYVGVLDAITAIVAETVHKRTEQSAKRVADAVAELTENE